MAPEDPDDKKKPGGVGGNGRESKAKRTELIKGRSGEVGEQKRNERLLSRFVEGLEAVKGFQKDFLGVHPVGQFNKDKIAQESPTFSSYTGQCQEGRLGPRVSKWKKGSDRSDPRPECRPFKWINVPELLVPQ